MADGKNALRSWQEIVAQAARTHDPEKLNKLSEELERALDERGKKLRSDRVRDARKQSASSR
jgi:hypothetical protein